jgi:hypothetical protein
MSKSEKAPAADLRPGVPTYQVSRGDQTRQIQASNKREALRRFEHDDQRVEAELVKGDETVPGLIPASGNTAPEKRRYRVTWGDDSREVVAVHKDDAWSQFIGNQENHLAYKFPKLYERIVEDLGPADDGGVQAAQQGGETSPVEEEGAAEAKDEISRMRSADKLKAIAANDHRATVRKAAEDRLKEINGE